MSIADRRQFLQLVTSGALASSVPASIAKADSSYKNEEDYTIAKRAGLIDGNPDGTDDYVNEES